MERMAGGHSARGYAEIIPDLVVEVVAGDYRQPMVDSKTQMWLDAGVRLALVAYIDTQEIMAHHDDGTVQRFGPGDMLTCEPVLPGFTCSVDDIFAY